MYIGPPGSGGGPCPMVGICLKWSEEENSWNRKKDASSNYPQRAETFEGGRLRRISQMLLCCGWQPACATLGFYAPERLVVPSESSYDRVCSSRHM